MKQAKITFCNGDVLIVSEGDVLVTVNSFDHNGIPTLSMNSTVPLENHHHDGLIPSILQAIYDNPYFYGPSGIDVIYVSSSIVKIENI